MKLVIIGTHPFQTTGYSNVMFNILKELESYPQIFIDVFGIQKFTDVNDKERSVFKSGNIFIHDVNFHDKTDFGFGTSTLKNYIEEKNPDVVMIYNDANVVDKYIQNLNLIKDKKFKIIVYLDMIYEYQNVDNINYICKNSDHIFCFTEYWLKILNFYNTDVKKSVLKHGINTSKLVPLNSQECKEKIGFKKTDFVFLNLNRNQTRKRLEITVIAFVKFLKLCNPNDAYIFFANLKDNKGIDVLKIFRYELKKEELNEDYYIQFLKYTAFDKLLSDTEINMIYNACDVGINTCEAEGFGLCNYEHASLGKPQIVSNLGGLRDFFNHENSLVCNPKQRIYSDNGGDLTGDGLIVDPEDVCLNMARYYQNRKLYNQHSEKLATIKDKYIWKNEVKHFVEILEKL
jgi:hypothetical protein